MIIQLSPKIGQWPETVMYAPLTGCEDLGGSFILLIKLTMHQLFHSTQTWTMPGRFETITKSNQKSGIPGPGDYNFSKVTHRAPTSVIGTQRRDDPFKAKVDTPGPGAHNFKSYIDDGPKRSMSARHDLRAKATPGPQDYQVDLLKTKRKEPVFSMSARSRDYLQIVRDNNLYKPAPNMYDAKGSFNNPKGVIGTSKRKDLTETEKTPGPGYYMNSDQLEKQKMSHSFAHPRCSIGSNMRNTDINPLLNNPGPGAYEKNSLWDDNRNRKKGYTMRPKTADIIAQSRKKIPGPGHYADTDYNSTKKKFPGYTCGSDKRLTFIDQANRTLSPGPGTHTPDPKLYRSVSAHKFGNSLRKDLYDNEKTPGPNYYAPDTSKVLNKAPGFAPTKFRNNLDEFLGVGGSSLTPGPQSYDPRLTLVKQSSKISEIPHSHRPGYEKGKFSPGPGYYNLHAKKGGPTWKFTTQKRINFTYSKQGGRVPGSGDYQIPGMIPNPPKYMTASNYISKTSMASTKGFRTTR